MGGGKPEGCLEKVKGKLDWSGLKVVGGKKFFLNSIVQALVVVVVVVVVVFVFIVVVCFPPLLPLAFSLLW